MDWYILMILTYTTDIGKMSELTLGQGHKFKGQGQICNFVKIRVLAIYPQPMIAHRWCTYTG